VHSDVWFFLPVLSTNGNRYYVHFIDAFSRFCWVLSCKLISELGFDETFLGVDWPRWALFIFLLRRYSWLL